MKLFIIDLVKHKFNGSLCGKAFMGKNKLDFDDCTVINKPDFPNWWRAFKFVISFKKSKLVRGVYTPESSWS